MEIRTISVRLLYLAGVFYTGLELSLAPILDELTRCSHLGVLFLHFPCLRSQRPAGALCHHTAVRLRAGRSWSLFWPRDTRYLSNCISVLPFSIWVWLDISGPCLQLKTVVLPVLIFLWGRAYVTGSKWSMRLRMEWLRKINLRTAISLDILLLPYFYLRRPLTCGFDPIL